MKIQSSGLPGSEIDFVWDMGTQFASDLLNDINLVSKRQAPFRIDTRDYKIYWAGTILRIDIPKEAVS